MPHSVPGKLCLAVVLILVGTSSTTRSENTPSEDNADRIRGLMRQARYADAESAARSALAEEQAANGTDSVGSSRLLDLLVESMNRGGKASDPENRRLADRAIELKTTLFGAGHAEVALSLRNLAVLFSRSGDYARSRPLFEEVLALQENALGGDHVELARTLREFASLKRRSGDFEGAAGLLERALVIRVKAMGEEDADVALIVNDLGIARLSVGEYAEARTMFERALRLAEKTRGPGHPAVANAYSNLGIILDDTGDYAEAREVYTRALDIMRKARGPESLEAGQCLNNLALTLMNLGDYGAAKPLFEDSLRIRETLLGPEHPDVAQQCLNNLGRLHLLSDDLTAAEVFYRRSLAIQEKVLDAWHPHLAETLQGLAEVLKSTGSLAEAEPLYRRAASIQEKARGPGHPYVGETLEGLAEVLMRSGRDGEALLVALKAEEVTREHLRLTALTLPERQALRYAARRGSGLGAALSLLTVGSDPVVVQQVWDAVIRSRAVVLDEIASRSRSQIHSETPEMSRLYQTLASARAKLAHLVVQGDPAQDREEFLRRVEEARRGQENAERALAETSADFRRRRLGASIGLREVRESLPPQSALIAFVRYSRLQRPSGGSGPPRPEGSVPSYAAFVLEGSSADPRVVPLGSADRIDPLIRAWRAEAAVAPPAVRAAALRSEARCREAGERLRRAIWDPIATLVPDARNLLVVPDALLSLVNLAALPAGADRYLAEETFTVHYLSAERDLVPSGPRPVPTVGLLAIGAPTYDAPARATQHEKPAGTRGGSSPCLQFRKMTFAPLPGALKEVSGIEALWSKRPAQVVRLTGGRATEEAVKRLAGQAQVLHLATHGVFISDCAPPLGEAPAEADRRSGGDHGLPAMENPFLLSGLALAGANRRLLARDEEEDGILTAGEIASLDLGAVDWAVLSGCDTGLGRVLAGEGVLGLRRAFQIAGARTMIMSLWPVDDSATRFWMNELYRHHLNGDSTADAVRAADLGALAHRRQSGWSTHPYYWSAFVASGDWR